jgi:hypothetical protein
MKLFNVTLGLDFGEYLLFSSRYCTIEPTFLKEEQNNTDRCKLTKLELGEQSAYVIKYHVKCHLEILKFQDQLQEDDRNLEILQK